MALTSEWGTANAEVLEPPEPPELPGEIRPLQWNLNRLAGTLDDRGIPTLSAQGAAQKWSGTSLALQGALNAKAGNPRTEWVGVQEVLNQLAGTFGLGMDAASSLIES